jgi:AcrR family transcriptional regulator
MGALRAFGARGFHAVTTREIARACRANQASVWYHFGSKEKLYLAVTTLIADDGRRELSHHIQRARREAVNCASARKLIQELLIAFARDLLKLSDDGAAALFIARELATPAIGHATIYEWYLQPLHAELTALVARATARHGRAQSAIIDAHALIGATLGFVAAKRSFKHQSSRPVNSDDRIAAIGNRIAHLAARICERPEPRPAITPTPALHSRSRRSPSSGSRKSRAETAFPNASCQ